MNLRTSNLVKASLFLALGLILPFIFHSTGVPGQVFLPMHIPVLLCGFILGPQYGVMVGIVTPLLSSLLTGMPPLFPIGVSMIFELATYGLVGGYLYRNRKINLYISLIISMISGRLISGIMKYILMVGTGKAFVLKGFLIASFVTCIWGIVIQFILIPLILSLYNNHIKHESTGRISG
ncbi:ECF transporter S component [Oceanirhabdus sp. W0125-5]|uniref:ECF transporter S component n=1 Tax=Oceanirhabdus sp. W0125-5 TaxID=2999116 RepID=UPI0022F2B14F|nr:ECF transporter S component [Oceanirhabdus sp. W0125-5]WBW96808.1 ECF transporter S component [Oceanirhabdus sp. W0125-5]